MVGNFCGTSGVVEVGMGIGFSVCVGAHRDAEGFCGN